MSRISLPQKLSTRTGRDERAFQLSLARTAYNYVRSYPHLESVPLSANVPPGEEFSADYNAILLRVLGRLADNFLQASGHILERQLEDDSPRPDIQAVIKAFKALSDNIHWYTPWEDVDAIETFIQDMSTALPKALTRASSLSFDLNKMLYGLEATLRDAVIEGPTAILKATLFAMLGMARIGGADLLKASSTADFKALLRTLPEPLMLTIKAPWNSESEEPCEQDWFFAYLQVAGFNTTNLRGVTVDGPPNGGGVALQDLLKKLPITDQILQDVLGNQRVTLESAARAGKLYVCDYAMLAPPVAGSTLHGRPRFVAAPIALFYWNEETPLGYPPEGYDPERPGVLQPIAIQLAQTPDAETAPLFTPNDCAGANDKAGLKWRLAKLIVNSSCATQHESVAHLGECHLVMGTIVLATHRQLAKDHPLFKLLWPHMRFTLPINDGAMHNLVIPGGVVAANVGTAMSSTLDMINAARQAFRWDENSPTRSFEARAVTSDQIAFPFRDDTLLLWRAIKNFVGGYLAHYYPEQSDLTDDHELQAWINELTSPEYGAFEGMNGLVRDEKNDRWRIESVDYLTEVVAQILYIAGPKHASVNYPQYPLGSYAPSVAASVYAPPPTRSQSLTKPEDCLHWYLPLDVALYAISFEYLLSGVQYDKLGHYDSDLRTPYFDDPAVNDLVAAFQAELATIETVIRARNRMRPAPYPFQLPSQVPNSISI